MILQFFEPAEEHVMIAGWSFGSSISTDYSEKFFPDIFDFLLHKSTILLL